MQKLETALVIVALVSLWPLIVGYSPLWYQVCLGIVLGLMLWVAMRRLSRVRAASEEAKRKRDEMERGGRPPTL